MPKPRRKNRRPAAKCKKKPQKPARARSASRSYSYSRSGSYSESEGSSDGHSDEDDPRDYKRGGYHPVMPYQLYNARYRVLSKLGAGAFSTVWLCADEKVVSGPLVAMKVCKSKKSVAEQAQDEVMLFEQMQQNGRSSPFVVKMTDHFWHTGPNGRHKCMTFEVMGENLLALVKYYDYNGIPLPLCRRLSRHTLKGLEYIHACGVIHTDVKLENVLICRHDMTALVQEASQAHLAFSEQKGKLESLSKSQKKRLKKKNKKAAEAAEAADAKASDEEIPVEDGPPAPEVPQEADVNGNGYGHSNGAPVSPAAPGAGLVQPVPPVRQRERFSTLKLEEAFAKLADFGNGIKVLELGKDKHASNVVEKCFEASTTGEHAAFLKEERQRLIRAVLGPAPKDPSDRSSPLVQLMDDRFGKYVANSLVEYSRGPEEMKILYSRISSAPGKKASIASLLEMLERQLQQAQYQQMAQQQVLQFQPLRAKQGSAK